MAPRADDVGVRGKLWGPPPRNANANRIRLRGRRRARCVRPCAARRNVISIVTAGLDGRPLARIMLRFAAAWEL